ncbi:hypothetical protein BpHYR1_046562, partial [Brachionus plicatilis]
MSYLDSKANYHPVSQLAGNLPNGSYLLPGTEYYSVEGKAPKLQFEHSSKINDAKYRYSQSYRIDPIYSLLSLKNETTLTKYAHHNPPVEQCRDRYLFVPKFYPRDDPNYVENAGLNELKALAQDNREYRLNEIPKLPDMDTHVLPKENLDEEAFRLYGATKPYDMTVLRETKKFNPVESNSLQGS